MQPVLQMISRVGPSDANVLITGEPGTGKEVVAKTLFAISPRSAKPMVTVNAGGLAEGVFESSGMHAFSRPRPQLSASRILSNSLDVLPSALRQS